MKISLNGGRSKTLLSGNSLKGSAQLKIEVSSNGKWFQPFWRPWWSFSLGSFGASS